MLSADDSEQAEGGGVMAGITVPIKVDLPDNWLEMVVDRLRNDPDGEWTQVIRCKDCTRFDKKKGCNLVEGLNIAKADSFCSYGIRREDE